MGLRDSLKAKVKGILGVSPPATPAASPSTPAPIASPAPVSVVRPAPPSVEQPVSAAGSAAEAVPVEPSSSEIPWQAVCPSAKVTEEKPGTYAHGRYNVSVYRLAGALYAMDDACAHEDGPIGEGQLDGSCVTCPYHDWKYDFTTGACLTQPDRTRATFAVKDESGSVWIGPRLTRGSDSRGGDHDDGMEVIRR